MNQILFMHIKLLKEYEAPELDPAIDEALLEFIAKRKSEFEDRDY